MYSSEWSVLEVLHAFSPGEEQAPSFGFRGKKLANKPHRSLSFDGRNDTRTQTRYVLSRSGRNIVTTVRQKIKDPSWVEVVEI